jgi:hypothetical protein
MTCRAATSASTCAGGSPTGSPMTWDTEGRLVAWTSPTGAPWMSSVDLYDGEGTRVQQQTVVGGVTTQTYSIGNLEDEPRTCGCAPARGVKMCYHRSRPIRLDPEHPLSVSGLDGESGPAHGTATTHLHDARGISHARSPQPRPVRICGWVGLRARGRHPGSLDH